MLAILSLLAFAQHVLDDDVRFRALPLAENRGAVEQAAREQRRAGPDILADGKADSLALELPDRYTDGITIGQRAAPDVQDRKSVV